jgi:predicted dienelactone hydrolase
MRRIALTTVLLVAAGATPLLAENRIDGQSPDAPELAAYGPLNVGVRQFQFTNPDQVNILAVTAADPRPIYDRPLTVEVWYPAAAGATGDTAITANMRDGTPVTLEGRAMRDAALAVGGNPYPLLLLSHGYPGNRFLMSHLAENLASKGYVVASIDHTDSTYNDQRAFASTLVNRPLDQLFVLDQMAKLGSDPGSEFSGMIDADNAGLLGYSMGGYGALVTAGAGITEARAAFGPQGSLEIHVAGSETHEALPDPRIKTAIAIGPWGRQLDFWDAEGLSGIEIPTLFIAGSNDTVSGYTNGVRRIWEEAVNSDRALLTFDGGSHNTVAPIPAPEESYYFNTALGFNVSEHYTDPVWDTVFMNNVGQHFVTSWLDRYLKGDLTKERYLDLVATGGEGVWSQNPDGSFADDHTYWAGFREGTAEGLRFERLPSALAPVPLPATVWLLAAALGGIGVLRRRRTG